MKVSELFDQLFEDGIGVARITGRDAEITGLAYDSRRVAPGSLFAALPGNRSDGHDHVADAVARGAVAVLCERAVDTGSAAHIEVPDSRRALARATRRFYGDPASKLRMVGVTGTNGKTTTVHLVEGVLTAAGIDAGVIGTLGSRYRTADGDTVEMAGDLTTPESVDLVESLATMAASGTRAVAMEVSSHALDQQRTAGVSFDVGVFTNLTHDHLDYHGTIDAYFVAKARLFRERLKGDGRAVLNLDDPRGAVLSAEAPPGSVGFSRTGIGRVHLEHLSSTRAGIVAEIRIDGAPVRIESNLVGDFNAENLLAATATGVALEIEPQEIAAGLAAVRAVPGRLERISAEPLVLVDYAHTPDALAKALATTRAVTSGRVLCVFGCGGDRDADKRASMGAAVAAGADWSIVTNDNPRTEEPAAIVAAIVSGLEAAGWRRGRDFVVELDRRAAIEQAIRAAGAEDAVLIAGKGHETYQIVGTTRHRFDDREQARAVLGAAGSDRRGT